MRKMRNTNKNLVNMRNPLFLLISYFNLNLYLLSLYLNLTFILTIHKKLDNLEALSFRIFIHNLYFKECSF